jgi:hypothetical protein
MPDSCSGGMKQPEREFVGDHVVRRGHAESPGSGGASLHPIPVRIFPLLFAHMKTSRSGDVVVSGGFVAQSVGLAVVLSRIKQTGCGDGGDILDVHPTESRSADVVADDTLLDVALPERPKATRSASPFSTMASAVSGSKPPAAMIFELDG